MNRKARTAVLVAASLLCAAGASAQTIKIGSVLTLSGPNATLGENMDKAIKLYMKLHQDKLPPGVKVEVITRDDGTKQWAYKGKPLYYFSMDKAAGDKAGDGRGMVWHIAKP